MRKQHIYKTITERSDQVQDDYLTEHPKSKEKWKMIVRYHENKYWHEICIEDQSNQKTMVYFQIQENR